MTRHAARKSSFTLPAHEHARVVRLKKAIGATSNTEVIRRSLALLEESLSRDALRARFSEAAVRLREVSKQEIGELEGTTEDGLTDE